jgi:hypothetical protein
MAGRWVSIKFHDRSVDNSTFIYDFASNAMSLKFKGADYLNSTEFIAPLIVKPWDFRMPGEFFYPFYVTIDYSACDSTLINQGTISLAGNTYEIEYW